jgi:hypothetical protein
LVFFHGKKSTVEAVGVTLRDDRVRREEMFEPIRTTIGRPMPSVERVELCPSFQHATGPRLEMRCFRTLDVRTTTPFLIYDAVI